MSFWGINYSVTVGRGAMAALSARGAPDPMAGSARPEGHCLLQWGHCRPLQPQPEHAASIVPSWSPCLFP